MIIVIDLGKVESTYLGALAMARAGMTNRYSLSPREVAAIDWHEPTDRKYLAEAKTSLLREACARLSAWMRPLDFTGPRAAIRLKCYLEEADYVCDLIVWELERYVEYRLLAGKLSYSAPECEAVVAPLRQRLEQGARECISQIKELCFAFER